MHRCAQIVGLAAVVTLAAACGNHQPEQVGGAAAPVGLASSTPAPTVSTTDAPAATPTATTPSSAPPTTAKPAHTDPADLTIHPDHIGPLKIGMSLTAARATGLVVVNAGQGDAGPDTCVSAHWKGEPDSVWMVFNGKYGLRALDSFGNQKTPEGIKPGSTLAAVRRAYPHLTWRIDGDNTPDAQRTSGDALIDAVQGDGAHYRIAIEKSKVTDVQLESDRDGCYE